MSTAENIALTKSYITEALFALMEKESFDDISVSEICQKAGVGRATFYRHFGTKEDIVRDYFAAETGSFMKMIPQKPETPDDYYEMIFTAFSQLKKERKVFERLIAAGMESYYLEYVNRMLSMNLNQAGEDGQQGAGAPERKFSYLPYHISGSICNVSLEWVRRGCKESVKQITDEYFQYFRMLS